MGGSRPSTPYLSEGSLLSPRRGGRNTEDSFQHFMSRMVQQYVREEELRARHQATLLQLRENALKEKTKVKAPCCCSLSLGGGGSGCPVAALGED